MADTKNSIGKNSSEKTAARSDEEGYKIAKLIRIGSRELDRQLNVKKSRSTR